MPFGYVSSSEWVVEACGKPMGSRDPNCSTTKPGIGGSSVAVAEHDRRDALRGRRHRVTIEQKRATEAVDKQPKLILERVVIGPMRLSQPLIEL